jgi:hypothetical protein
MTRPEPIECIVLRTNESESKKNGLIRTVTLMVPNDGPHAFAGLVGERLHIIALNVQDDETTKPVPLSGASPEATAGQGEGAARPASSSPEPKERKPWVSCLPSQQTAIRCGEPEFWEFLTNRNGGVYPVRDADAAAAYIRIACGVESRAHLNTNSGAQLKWELLENDYWAWQRDPRRSAA